MFYNFLKKLKSRKQFAFRSIGNIVCNIHAFTKSVAKQVEKVMMMLGGVKRDEEVFKQTHFKILLVCNVLLDGDS